MFYIIKKSSVILIIVLIISPMLFKTAIFGEELGNCNITIYFGSMLTSSYNDVAEIIELSYRYVDEYNDEGYIAYIDNKGVLCKDLLTGSFSSPVFEEKSAPVPIIFYYLYINYYKDIAFKKKESLLKTI